MTLLVEWLSCFPWHVHSHFCISHSYWHDWFSLFYIILFISTYYFFLLYTFFLSCFLLSLCVDMDGIPVLCLIACCMTTLLLCDACVACPCGAHIYPLTSNSLISVDFVSLDLTFDTRLVTLLVSSTELVIRSKI